MLPLASSVFAASDAEPCPGRAVRVNLKQTRRFIEALLPKGWTLKQKDNTLLVSRTEDVLMNKRVFVENRESAVLAGAHYEIQLRFVPKMSAEDWAAAIPQPMYSTAQHSVYLTVPAEAQGSFHSAEERTECENVAGQIRKLLAPHGAAADAAKNEAGSQARPAK
jgi:hypothetical protein